MIKTKYSKYDLFFVIAEAKKGDIKALEELIRRIQKDIYSMFNYLTDKKQDISDLTQMVLVKMSKNLKNLNDIKAFKSWLNQIITNTFYDYIREKNKENAIEHNEDKLLKIKDQINCEPGEKCFYAEIEKLIKAALLSLPEQLRIALVLREYEGLSYDDISRITNTTIGTVKSRISRARIKLQKELKEFI